MYVKGQPFIPQFFDPSTGERMASGTVEFYLYDTVTPTPYYTNAAGTSGGTSLTLGSGGKPSTDIFFDSDIVYKIVVKNAAGTTLDTIKPYYPVDSLGTVRAAGEFVKEFASTSTAIASTTILEGDVLNIRRPALTGETIEADVVLSSSVTENALDIVQCTGVGTLSLVMRNPIQVYYGRKNGLLGDDSASDLAGLQALADKLTSGGVIMLEAGTYRITDTFLFKHSNKIICGAGIGITKLKFVNASGGIMFSGDSNKKSSTTTYTNCGLMNLSVISDSAANDASDIVDLTSFAYSNFENFEFQSKRANANIFYGQGNNGSSPYYNRIANFAIFGNTDYTQKGFNFVAGAWTGGSAGPNANIITHCKRAASLDFLFDIHAGNGNLVSDIHGESIGGAYIRLNSNTEVTSGTSTGSNGQVTLIDTGAAWTSNEYVNYGVEITGGTGSGQSRIIGSNTSTTLTLKQPWGVVPDATSTYAIYKNSAHSNKFSNIRAEGLDSQNPDFIQALPGTYGNEVHGATVESLGSGLYVDDRSGSTTNKWFGGGHVAFTESVINPGPSANIDVYVKNGSLGGVTFPQDYVIDYLKVACSTSSLGASCTGALSSGATSVLSVTVPNGNDVGMDVPSRTEKIARSGGSGVFINITTGSSFSATADLQVSWGATLV